MDKKNLISLLEAGNSCMLVPGGNRETLFMEHGFEVHDNMTLMVKFILHKCLILWRPVVHTKYKYSCYMYKVILTIGSINFIIKLNMMIFIVPMAENRLIHDTRVNYLCMLDKSTH